MGAGYSGLARSPAFDRSTSKLDRSLISGIDGDSERAALVGALAGYSKQVGSMLVAEGVETEAELAVVRELGVPLVQGYHFSRPAPPWPELSPGWALPRGSAGDRGTPQRATSKSLSPRPDGITGRRALANIDRRIEVRGTPAEQAVPVHARPLALTALEGVIWLR